MELDSGFGQLTVDCWDNGLSSNVFAVCGDDSWFKIHVLHYCQAYNIPWCSRENSSIFLLLTANKSDTVLYRAPIFSLLMPYGGLLYVFHLCWVNIHCIYIYIYMLIGVIYLHCCFVQPINKGSVTSIDI